MGECLVEETTDNEQINEPGILVITNAFYQTKPLNTWAGDLLFTKAAMYYYPYCSFQSTGSLGSVATNLIGGAAGTIANTIIEGDKKKDALIATRNGRRRFKGMCLKDLLERSNMKWTRCQDRF